MRINSGKTNVSGTTAWLRLALALFLLLPFVSANAQFDSGSVLGYVKDASGAAVPNAKITMTNIAAGTSQTATTDNDGRYEFNSVPIGNYRVESEAAGFDRARTPDFQLTTNARQRVDVAMKAGSVTETVTVSSAPTVLETETSSRGQVIGTKQIEDLPLNGRSYADLALLAPGVRKSVLENQTTTNREASFNINGQRSAFNNFLLDGLDNNSYGTSNQGFANENIPPSPDAVSEFRIETNNYSAEYGRASGGVINASIRRGTNKIHGRAWDYDRNTVFNAIGPFKPTSGVKPAFIRNQFGATLGGPIWKDHTFLFLDWESVRQIALSFGTATLPTAEQRTGTFLLHNADGSTTPIPLQNPVTGTVYANGIIPTADQSPLSKLVLAALPLPNNGAPLNTSGAYGTNYSAFPRGTINDDKGDARIDHTFNEKLSVFGVYSQHQTAIFDPPTFGGVAGGNANSNVHLYNRQIAVGVTYVLTPTSLLDFRIGIGHNEGGKSPYGLGNPSLLTAAGITNGIPTDPLIVRSLNAQSVSGFTQFGTQPASPQFQNPSVINPKANYTFVHGRHSMKVGYEYQAINTQINDYNPSYGQDNYSGKLSAVVPCPVPQTVPPVSPCTPADLFTQVAEAQNLADFIFGNRNSYSLTNFFIASVRQRMNFMYFQDDIKVMPNLTVNAGLRYELATPQYEANNKLANFDPGTKSLIQASSGSIYNKALVNMPLTNVAPRLGMAYSLSPKTVIRTGYGITYTQFNRAGGENNLTYNGPNVVNATINNPKPTLLNRCTSDTQDQTACFRQTQQGYAIGLTAAANFKPALVTSRYIPKDTKTGYVQSYHLSVQTQLPGGIVADIAYVGNKGTHLQILADYNQSAVCTTATVALCPTLAARRPVPTFGDIEIAYGGGSSNYNSLQFKTEKRYGNGLYLLNSFTWGRTFDLSGGHLETNNGDNSRVNFANPSGDYGRSNYDQPLNDTTSIIYDLPFGRGRRFGARAPYMEDVLLGGWQLTVINSMTSGLPANLNYTNSTTSGTNVTDLYTYRPNIIGGASAAVAPASNRVKTNSALTGYLVKFGAVQANGQTATTGVQAPTGTNPFGNAQRNSIVGPAFYQTDLGLHKDFRLWSDASQLEFRAEAFNVLNKVNYQAPDTNVSNGTFGNITGFYQPRQLQLAAKIIF